ncbi:CoA ester lyase [Microbaculum marinum]|uniref:CoA ester lyase n=1 Tax=Microbaculum marinum TaxID=1764581 RepID=A0AAW9RPI7_9HYPH
MSKTIRPRRSVLYMPGSNARALEKARTLPADALILDLEDAVAPDVKAEARDQVAAAVAAGGYGGRELVIRINALDTEWGHADLAAAIDAGPNAILVPKASRAADLEAVSRRVEEAGRTIALWAMVETPLALLNIREIAGCAAHSHAPLACFVMGTNDLAKETRARFVPGRAPMLPWLVTSVLAARAHGLDIIDGVYNDFRDEEGFRAECIEARDLGMDGKTLIHPAQVAAANEVFAPADAEVEQARRIIAAFEQPENRGKGAISLDGRMVELLHAEMAKRTVALAEAIGGTSE